MAEVAYSICPDGSGDKKTGSPTLTMSSGVATLTVAQTGNIGVGCRVTYNTSSIAYISQMNSSTELVLITATGGTPSDEGSAVTVNSIAHEYASFSAFEAGFTDANHINNTDITAAGANIAVANAPHYYDDTDYTADTTSTTVAGFTDDATHYLKLFTPQGGTESVNNQRHPGYWDANKSIINIANAGAIDDQVGYLHMDGLQLGLSSESGNTITYYKGSGSGAMSMTNTLLRGCNGTNYNTGAKVSSGDSYFGTCAATYFGSGFWSYGIGHEAGGGTVSTMENCTVANVKMGYRLNGGTISVKNCYVHTISSGAEYSGTHGTLTDCFHESSTSYTGSTGSTAYTTANFTSVTSGSEDFHLSGTGSALYHACTSTSLSVDIDGDSWFSSPSAGIDEVPSGGTVHNKTLTDVISISDQESESRMRDRTAADTLSMTDLTSIMRERLMTGSSTITLLDVLSSFAIRGRTSQDNIVLVDDKQKEAIKILSSSASVSDGLVVTLSAGVKILLDTLSVSDSIDSQLMLNRLLGDSINASDMHYKLKTLQRNVDIQVSDAASRALSITGADSISLVDTAVKIKEVQSLLLSAISVDDSIEPVKSLIRLVSDTLDVSDDTSLTLVQYLTSWGIIEVALLQQQIATSIKNENIDVSLLSSSIERGLQ